LIVFYYKSKKTDTTCNVSPYVRDTYKMVKINQIYLQPNFAEISPATA